MTLTPKLMKKYRKLVPSVLAMSFFMMAWVLNAQIAWAATPPLSPGCYNSNNGNFVATECTNNNQEETTAAPHNKCYVIVASNGAQGMTVNEEINCATGTLAGSGGRLDDPQHVTSDCNDENITEENCGILRYIVIFINVLSAFAGIVVVGAIIYGGIQYSSAGSDPQKVSAAKARIRNAIIALLFFIFGYAILNWLVPGGVLQ